MSLPQEHSLNTVQYPDIKSPRLLLIAMAVIYANFMTILLYFNAIQEIKLNKFCPNGRNFPETQFNTFYRILI